jgi:hypothetical protein
MKYESLYSLSAKFQNLIPFKFYSLNFSSAVYNLNFTKILEHNDEGELQTISNKTHRGDDTNQTEMSLKSYYYIVIGGSISLVLGVLAACIYRLSPRLVQSIVIN